VSLGPYGGDITLDSQCLNDDMPGSGRLYRIPQESADITGSSPYVGFYRDNDQAHVWCVVRAGGPVIDTATNQSNVWIEVATTIGDLEVATKSFVPYASVGYADLHGLQECPAGDYS
jgi:hypothetical protein